MERVWDFFIRKKGFSYLLLVGIILFGLFAFLQLPRESSPEVQVPIAIITTVYPGASALDIEDLITNEIEAAVYNIENVDKITSTSREGISNITVQFLASANIENSVRKVRDEVDAVRSQLPSEAEDPVVSELDFVNQPIQTISIASDRPATEFISLVEDVQDELDSVAGVSEVTISGIPEREVQVVVLKEQLATYGLTITEVTQALQSANASLPIGSIEIDTISYPISFEGDLDSVEDMQSVVVTVRNGESIFLSDVALIADGVSESSTYSRVSVDGEPSVQSATLSVFKVSGGDITAVAKDVRERVAELEKGMLSDETVLISFDMGGFVQDDLMRLSSSAAQTIILVMLILLLALGWREALIAGFAIPLSFLLAFVGLYYSGNTINFISLFSLILAVGILVDSAIVITEAIHTRLVEHGDKEKAAFQTVHDFHWPLLSGTMTTIAVFAPLFLVSGVTGEFIASIPFTILFVLLASLVVALAIIPLVASSFLTTRKSSAVERRQEAYTERLQAWYQKTLRRFVGPQHRKRQHRFFWLLGGGFIFSALLVVFGFVPVIFFAQEDIDYIYITIEEEQGTVLAQTDLTTRAVEEYLYEKEYIDSFVTTVGSGSFLGGGGSGSHIAGITINLEQERDLTSTEIIRDLREDLGSFTTADVEVQQPNNGPPTGDPIVINIIGEETEVIEEAINQTADILSNIPGAVAISTTNDDTATQFVLDIDRTQIAAFGLNPVRVAQILRTSVSGVEATSINTPTGEIDVRVQLNVNADFRSPDETNQASIDDIEQLSIATPQGNVLVGSFATVSLEKASLAIFHEQRERVGRITADVAPDASLGEVLALFGERMEDTELPEGVRMTIGGETEDTTQAFMEILLSLLVGLISIIAILVLQFNSYRQVFFIILIIPLSLIGVFTGLALFGQTLSFPSVMGFIALSGIVVNNAIILIDVMNTLRREYPDKSIEDVVVEGATSRLRPILLTTVTTVVGVFPLTFASELWGPLAYAIMFGLSFAVIVTLLLVPILYSRWPGKVQ